jgi:hypothetical protein
LHRYDEVRKKVGLMPVDAMADASESEHEVGGCLYALNSVDP